MSRSPRAWSKDSRQAENGEHAGFVPRVRPRAGLLTGSLLAVLFAAAVLFASASSAQAKSSTTHTSSSTTHTSSSTTHAVVMLALGSGYYTPHGARSVRVLQRRLRSAGFSPGPIDGRYGPLTQAAVESFQASRRLPIDGIAGPVTLTALQTTYHSLYPGAGYTISGGSSAVRVMQRRLARAGFSPGPIDGRYGPLTAHAVARYQTAHRLPANGIADPVTLTTLTQHSGRPTSSHRPAKHRAPQRPVRTHPIPTPKPAPAPATAHRTSSPPFGLIAGLIALALVLTLATAWLIKRRRHERRTVITQAINAYPPDGHAEATAGQIHPTLTPPSGPPTTPDPSTSIAPRLVEDTPGERAFSYALLLEKHGDEQGAIAAYERADRLGHPAAATNLGVLLEHQGQHPAAEAAYRRAEQRGDAHGAFNLAVLLEARGDHEGAKHAYERAEALGHPEIAQMARAAEAQLDQQERPTQTGGSPDAR
jgi:peptidoglycan hydrolase-like protein with peptidoglycan-binding domain